MYLTAAAIALPLAVITVWTQMPHCPDDAAELHLLSVGSAQCCILQTPGGESVLLDAGFRSGPNPGQRILKPFFRNKRIPYPAKAFISHANSDHYNVLPEMITGGHTNRIYISDHFSRDDDPESPISLLVDLIEDRCDVIRTRQSDKFELDDKLTAEILWPPAKLPEATNSNDRSLVIRLDCSGTSALIPGDIGPDVQQTLCREPGRIKSDILILPHHGKWENYLEHFVREVNPRIMLVSCGRHQELPFSDFSGADRKHYSTSRNGWICVRFGGGNINIDTMR
jgi:competence protein ComEC